MKKTNKKEEVIKLDLGCGPNKKDGFIGVDSMQFKDQKTKKGKVDVVHDLTKKWPWKDESVDEVHCSHFVEHLTAKERIFFANELYRVLKKAEHKDGKPVKGFATIVTPHWASARAYGDMTHQWPPVSEFWYYYLGKEWRKDNAPHNTDYKCDFSCLIHFMVRADISLRNQEYQQHALANFKEAAQDLVAQVIKQ